MPFGICPICGVKITITGKTTDGRIIGSCGDAFYEDQYENEVVLEETLYDVGFDLVSHQKTQNFHRIVDCSTTPQTPGEWTRERNTATLTDGEGKEFTASYINGVAGGEISDIHIHIRRK